QLVPGADVLGVSGVPKGRREGGQGRTAQAGDRCMNRSDPLVEIASIFARGYTRLLARPSTTEADELAELPRDVGDVEPSCERAESPAPEADVTWVESEEHGSDGTSADTSRANSTQHAGGAR